jgi:hypothetical protein
MAKPRRKDQDQPVAPELSAPQAAGDTTAASPERDRIAMRAYELYLARGGGEGAAMDDWLRAEQELTGNRTESES